MDLIFHPNIVALSLLIPVLISGGLAIYTFARPPVVGSRVFAFLMLAVCVWSFFYGLELSCLSLDAMLTCAAFEYLGIATVPVLWLMLTLLYTGREKMVNRRNVILLFIIPFITIVLVATNPLHHLYYSSAGLDNSGLFPMMALSRGPWYWVNSVYSYALLLAGTILLIVKLGGAGTVFRNQVIAMLVGVSVPWVVNILYVAFGLMPLGHVDLTPYAFAVSGVVIAWGMFRYGLFDIVPVAYDTVVNSIDDAIVVMDNESRIVGYNRAAGRIFGLTPASMGKPAVDIWQGWPDLIELSRCEESASIEVVSGHQGSTQYYQASCYKISGGNKHIAGKGILLHDITYLKQAEEDVRLREAHLQSLVNILQYATDSVQEFLDYALNEAIHLTGSKIGYIYFYNEETKEFTLNSWSKDVMKECTITEKKTQYHLEKTGIWGEAVRQRRPIVVNDFQSPHPLKKGYPEGHAKLYKYLTVPVIMENRIVAVVAVANKQSDYTQADVLQLTLMMDSVWKETYSKRIEQQLRERMKELQAIYSLAELNTREGITLENLYQEFANILPKSFKYPEIACARVEIDGREFRTNNYADSPWKLSSAVKVNKSVAGCIEVCYLKNGLELDEGPFMKEEGFLLDALAERIGHITQRRQAEEMLRIAEEKYRSLVENINDIFYLLDNHGNFTYISPAVERITMYKASELIGKPVFPLIHPDDLPGLLESFNHPVEGKLVPRELRWLDKDGRVIFVRVSRQLLYKNEKVIGVTAVVTDITERKRMEQRLEEMATHDFLTGLPNRNLLTDRFTMAAATAHRNKARLAVMSLDLDKFKTINDTLGHAAGDLVLKTVSARLTGIIRASDTLARIGGDEFILVMIETNHEKDATAIAQKILNAFEEPLFINGQRLQLSTSIGIAIYPDDGDDMETLIKKSDAALYYSKGHGRNQYKFFGDGDVKIGGDHKSPR